MSLPDYIKTEWKSRGHVIMKFVDSDDYSCQNEIENKDNKGAQLPEVSFPLSPIKNEELDVTVSGAAAEEKLVLYAVECYLSTHNVWEYEELKEYSVASSDTLSVEGELQNLSVDERKLNKLVNDILQDGLQENKYLENAEKKTEEQTVVIPPSISDDTWQLWLSHWEEWKDKYVNLAWIQRFPKLSKEDSKSWQKNYLFDNPVILSYINYCPNICLENERDIKEHDLENFVPDKEPQDETKREIMNRLYDEFYSKRYWVHFRLFLRDLGYEISPDLQEFFLAHEIMEEPAAAAEHLDSADKLELSDAERLMQSCVDVFVDKIDRETEKEYLRDATQQDLEKDNVTKADYFDEDQYDLHAGNSHSEFLVKNKNKLHNKGKKTKNRGVAWALQHVQKLASETGSVQSGNEPYMFGTSKNEVTLPAVSTSKLLLATELSCDDRTAAKKRKHEEVDPAALKNNKNKQVVSRRNFKFWPLNIFESLQKQFQNIWSLFTHLKIGFNNILTTFVIPLIETNYSSFSFGFRLPGNWFHWMSKKHIQQEASKRMESRALNNFKNLFKPIVRKFPFPPLMTTTEVRLNEVVKQCDERFFKEDLVKVCQVDSDDKENKKKELYVLYLTEEDIDYILEDVVELSPVEEKSSPIRNTQIIFDEEGNPQTILKIPADSGKRRFLMDENCSNDIIKLNGTEDSEDEKEKLEDNKFEDWLYQLKIVYDNEGNPMSVPSQSLYPLQKNGVTVHQKINSVLKNCCLMRHSKDEIKEAPEHILAELAKYWHQRYRLFLRYDEGIHLDDESWYSVTPEMIASHHAERCTCDTVIDAFCGAGGNAIQLAATCKKVIAIDIDPAKIALARHNAKIYGVLDQIEFIEGDFFALAPNLKADVILLSPPWSGIGYNKQDFYDIFSFGGLMDGKELFRVAKSITQNIALYIPKNTNIFQVIELAGPNGKVDLEYNHISNKRKSMTAYYGDLVDYHPIKC